MKTIHEILILVKERYKKEIKKGEHFGLCYFAEEITFEDGISEDELGLFKIYIRKSTEDFDFYYCPDLDTKEPGQTMNYYWHREDTQSRFEWLDENIELTKPKDK